MAAYESIAMYNFPPTPPSSSPPPFPRAHLLDDEQRKLSHLGAPQLHQAYQTPLFKRIIPKIGYFTPIYNYLATPPPSRPSTASFNSNDDDTYIELDQLTGEEEDNEDMVKTSTFRFSASAGNRTFTTRQPQIEGLLSPPSSEGTYYIADTPTALRSAKSVHTPIEHRKGKLGKEKASTNTRGAARANEKKKIPSCYQHQLRHPRTQASCDVVPCDWVRPRNSHRFNNYTNADVQCGIPKCETCIAEETYGPNSVWALSAPKGQTAESHRLRSRVRYLCGRCEQPAPPPPEGGFGPIEMCTCVLRDHAGLPTDIWFQCSDCAESNWFEHDARFQNPEGKPIARKPRKRKNKYGIVIKPRTAKETLRIKRCCCGKMVPKDGRYGIWCTWCNCPVDGEAGIELGGAATRSGPAFVIKKEDQDDSESENEEDIIDDDDKTMVDADHDASIAFCKANDMLEGDTIIGNPWEEEDSGIEI